MNRINIYKLSGRKRIRDRGISWKESYHNRSEPLRERFDKDIGVGSYRRWEGHDYTTNSDYYVVVGPSIQKDIGKRWFAGIKKLPPESERHEKKMYSPYGEYFMTIKSALSYASEKWGVPFPMDQIDYRIEDIINVYIPKHVKG